MQTPTVRHYQQAQPASAARTPRHNQPRVCVANSLRHGRRRVVREVDFSTLWVEKWLNLELRKTARQRSVACSQALPASSASHNQPARQGRRATTSGRVCVANSWPHGCGDYTARKSMLVMMPVRVSAIPLMAPSVSPSSMAAAVPTA
ncbi:MAG: hypothetical protein Ta2A_08580 [Treponemataceae bacterium]|nr:MAG: hypothetical protein Ta2A_08580 [Treponemataceae bacterium]